MKTITVYRESKDGTVEKEIVKEVSPIGNVAIDYHERIKRTYYTLECEGKLGDMSPRAKAYVRDVHTYAQEPGYWDS